MQTLPTAEAVEHKLETPAANGTFSDAEIAGLPEPVRRFFSAAIAPGTPLAVSAHLRMRGRVKVGLWLPFRAEQVLSPHHGFVWRGRVLGVLAGADWYADRAGASQWKALGMVPVIHQDGPDTSRSSAGRCGIEAMWLPTALLPRFGVSWRAVSDHDVCAAFSVDETPVELQYRIDDHGRPQSVRVERWGDPYGTGTHDWHAFGGSFQGYRTSSGITIPNRGRFGWSFGTPRWAQGEFFHYEIVALTPVQ